MQQQINDFRNSLQDGKNFTRLASYVARRLAAIGTVYAMAFGAFLLLAFTWRGGKKDDAPASNLFSLFKEAPFELVMNFWVQFFIALILVLMCAGWSRKQWRTQTVGTLFVAALVLPPVWLNGDPQTRILAHFLYAVLLLAAGLIFDRTFGYTRSLARRNFYLGRITALESIADDAKRTEELHKLFEAYAADKYRDHVGDTIFTLEALKAKAAGK